MSEAPEVTEETTAPPLPAIEQDESADDEPSHAESGLCGATSVSGSWWGGLTSGLASASSGISANAGGWIQVAKDKSVSALEFVKKDIDEFKQTMSSDSSTIACNVRSHLNQETATMATEKVKHGMHFLLDGIKMALIIPPDDDDEAEPIFISTAEHIFDRAKARIHAIQIDPGTYCEEPQGSANEYETWKSSCDLEQKKGEISELLVSNVEVRALYTQMVPTTVSHSDFWKRYLYKMHQLDMEDQRRADLMKRADDVKKEDDLAWDDEDDWENMDSSSPERKVLQKPETKTHSTDEQADTQTDGSIPSVTETSTDVISSHDKDLSPESAAPAVAPSDDTLAADPPATDAGGLAERLAAGTEADVSVADQEKAQSLKTKEHGDLVVVGDHTSSERTSPASSSDHSHNKESTDEGDWEKDFEIEVPEADVKQTQDEANDLAPKSKGNDEDWESWE